MYFVLIYFQYVEWILSQTTVMLSVLKYISHKAVFYHRWLLKDRNKQLQCMHIHKIKMSKSKQNYYCSSIFYKDRRFTGQSLGLIVRRTVLLSEQIFIPQGKVDIIKDLIFPTF